jgi:F-type H+-transporting ATPase subunit epsilon
MSKFSVDILTPSRVLVKDLPADSLLIPTELGEINPYPEHIHIISNLDTGILTVFNDADKKYFSVTGGICKILDKKVTILSKVSESSGEINRDRAEKAKKKAEEMLSGDKLSSKDDILKYKRKLDRAEVRIKISLLNK